MIPFTNYIYTYIYTPIYLMKLFYVRIMRSINTNKLVMEEQDGRYWMSSYKS